MLQMYWGEPDQRNTDNSTNYYDTPKYVVDVLGVAVSKTDVFSQAEVTETLKQTLSRAQVVTAETAWNFCSEVR